MNTADTLIAAAIENAVAREAEFQFMKKNWNSRKRFG